MSDFLALLLQFLWMGNHSFLFCIHLTANLDTVLV